VTMRRRRSTTRRASVRIDSGPKLGRTLTGLLLAGCRGNRPDDRRGTAAAALIGSSPGFIAINEIAKAYLLTSNRCPVLLSVPKSSRAQYDIHGPQSSRLGEPAQGEVPRLRRRRHLTFPAERRHGQADSVSEPEGRGAGLGWLHLKDRRRNIFSPAARSLSRVFEDALGARSPQIFGPKAGQDGSRQRVVAQCLWVNNRSARELAVAHITSSFPT